MEKARVREAVTRLRVQGNTISVRHVQALIGGSFRDVTRHLRQLRADGVLGAVPGGASSCPDAWHPLTLAAARQVARRLLTGEALGYTDPAGEIGYVMDKAAVPAPAWRRLAPIEARLVAGFLRTSRDLPPREAVNSVIEEHGDEAFERYHMAVFQAYHLNKQDIANPYAVVRQACLCATCPTAESLNCKVL